MKTIRIVLTALFFSLFGASFAQDVQPIASYWDTIPGTNIRWRMVLVPGGEFQLGSPETEANRGTDEGPMRTVKVDSFWMAEFEVLYEMYEVFRDKKLDKDTARNAVRPFKADVITRPSPPYEDPTFGMGKYGYPAASMTQFASLQFCKWLTEKTGRFYRLPSEAEWEYACRAGTKTPYFFGDDASKLGDYAWYYDNSDGVYHKPGLKKPNAYGLYDMLGNVAEWTLDQYKADYYASLTPEELHGPWSKPTALHPRTVRGGSYDDDPETMRSADRMESSMNWKRRDPQLPKSYWWNTDSPFVGFRIISPVKGYSQAEMRKFFAIALGDG
jgi:formylglycine-generating enzyme required for sulfatase activity